MHMYQDSFERDNPDLKKKELKPWHVREGDIILLEDLTSFPTKHIPVEVVAISTYPTFERKLWSNQLARTEWRFLHKPVIPEDRRYLYNWWETSWNRFDSVEIYRKK
jgi:hypothetical protein